MLNKKVLRSRKAISPILATLLLIVIAVAAIVVTYAWIMTYMSSTTQQAGVMLYPVNVRFYDDGGTKKIDIDIKDTGTAGTQITSIYIGTSASSMQNMTMTPSSPIPLAAGDTVRVTITYTWTSGTAYWFKIVPSVGSALGPFEVQASS
ncbi:MAG TPA: archaellin/type IV pilin N-terminal domain-containing protein [Acidobacteriota bacterium]|jgi:flagellin-like protein|nr:archaellin/type IV pilin N-terminal domain-containing protein [Acidobacteriota bacterium]